MSATVEVVRQHVSLSDDSILVFDYINGTYRMVLYRRRRPGETGHQVDSGTFDYLVGQRVLEHSYRTGWARFATFHPQLKAAIRHVLDTAESGADADSVELYVRHMPWGKDLP